MGFGLLPSKHLLFAMSAGAQGEVLKGIPREWPDRLLHVPTMNSYQCRIVPGHGARYGEFWQPRFYALSYTWGRWELKDGERPEMEALPIKNIPWAVPRIDPDHFTSAQFEQVLREITAPNIRIPEASSWPTPDFVWLDVACIDQRPNSALMSQEIGYRAPGSHLPWCRRSIYMAAWCRACSAV